MEQRTDKYQPKYLAHQKRKKKLMCGEARDMPFGEYGQEDLESLLEIMRNRHSRRIFTGKISKEELKAILRAGQLAPSSCNRKAIQVIESKIGVETLVGGRGWIDKADKVLLFYADMLAYKSPNEVDFMPYLDTGFIAQNIYLICEVLNIKCCFVNPNHQGIEIERDGYKICGAMALGR